jgi:hypothetical protein
MAARTPDRREAMAKARPHPWTVDDFLAFEADEPERYEFVDGIVRLMTGGSAAHSAIKGNIFAELRTALRAGRWRVDVDDLKVVTASATSPGSSPRRPNLPSTRCGRGRGTRHLCSPKISTRAVQRPKHNVGKKIAAVRAVDRCNQENLVCRPSLKSKP